MKRIKQALPLLLLLPVLLYPRAAASGASEGLALCGGVLMPSLFAFLVLSSWAISGGALEPAGRLMRLPMRLLFNLPPSAFAPLAVGLLCGYPAGARAAAAVYDSGALTKKQAERLLCFCVCTSPQFAIAAVGGALLGSVRYGVYIYCANLISCLLVGAVSGALSRLGRADTPRSSAVLRKGASGFTEAVADGTESILKICGFTLLFSSLLAIAEQTGLIKAAAFALSAGNRGIGDAVWSTAFDMFFEITGGSAAASALGGRLALTICAAGIGFGGVCVLCQCAALAATGREGGKRLSLLPFFLSRPLHAALTAVFTLIFAGLDGRAAPAFSAGAEGMKLLPTLTNIPAAVVMLMLSAVLLMRACGRNGSDTEPRQERKKPKAG